MLGRGEGGGEGTSPDLRAAGDTRSLLLPQRVTVPQPSPAGPASVPLPPGCTAIPPLHRGVTETGTHRPVLPSQVELASLNLTAAPVCTDSFPREVPRVIISPNCFVSQRSRTALSAVWNCNHGQVPFFPALWEVRVRRCLERRAHLASFVSDHCLEGFGPLAVEWAPSSAFPPARPKPLLIFDFSFDER